MSLHKWALCSRGRGYERIYLQIMSMYKGFGPAFGTFPFINAVVMSANEFAKRALGSVPGHETLFESMVAGTFAGFVNSYIIGPVELIKCRL